MPDNFYHFILPNSGYYLIFYIYVNYSSNRTRLINYKSVQDVFKQNLISMVFWKILQNLWDVKQFLAFCYHHSLLHFIAEFIFIPFLHLKSFMKSSERENPAFILTLKDECSS